MICWILVKPLKNNAWSQAQTKWMVVYGEGIQSDLIQMSEALYI